MGGRERERERERVCDPLTLHLLCLSGVFLPKAISATDEKLILSRESEST